MQAVMAALLMEVGLPALSMRPRPQVGVVIGGTAEVLDHLRARGNLETPPSESVPITRTWLAEWAGHLSGAELKERVALGVPPDRADVISAGAAILLAVLDTWGLRQCYVSHRNILDGFLIRMSRTSTGP
jgi:exopolyphosphatase/pppGpp-phosphohydrolase